MSVYKADNQQLEIWLDSFNLCDTHSEIDCVCGDGEDRPGYYAALGQPGCLFDSEIMGPYDNEAEAYSDINATFFDNSLPPYTMTDIDIYYIEDCDCGCRLTEGYYFDIPSGFLPHVNLSSVNGPYDSRESAIEAMHDWSNRND